MFGQKRREGSWLRAHEPVEACCGLTGALAFGWWAPAVWRPSHLVFCAFFLLIFAIAVRSHTFVAYSTAACAAAAYGLLLWQRPAVRPALLSLALEPFVLLLTGICTSDVLRWQRLRLATLEQTCTRTHEALQETREQCQQVAQAREALERQVREMPVSLITVSERLARWWFLEREQRFAALVDLLVAVLEAQSCACYVQEGEVLRLCAEQMIGLSAHAPVLDTASPLVQRVLEWRRVSTVYDALTGEQPVAPDMAVMAGPLLGPTGELAGVVIIESMPLLKLTSGATRLFGSLLQIFSLSLHSQQAGAPDSTRVVTETLSDPEQTQPALLVPSRERSRLSS